jgi:hypothetical protein
LAQICLFSLESGALRRVVGSEGLEPPTSCL